MRLVRGVLMRNRLVPHPQQAVKNQEGYLGFTGPTLGCTAWSTNAGRRDLHNIWQ